VQGTEKSELFYDFSAKGTHQLKRAGHPAFVIPANAGIQLQSVKTEEALTYRT
jgi:hypothetical protein